MSSSSHTNGTITLKSFTELAAVLDLASLPPGPADADADVAGAADPVFVDAAITRVGTTARLDPSTTQAVDLASVIAQLAHVSSGLETLACQDARAREQATIELAQFEALSAERQQAEQALVEAHRVRVAAEVLASEAFTEAARADAARHVAVARAAELTCTQLLAARVRAADELVSRPHLARMLAERRQREQERAEAAARADEQRHTRLADGLADATEARHDGRLEEARDRLVALARDFPDSPDIRPLLDAVRWQLHRQQSAPAVEAMDDVMRRHYRDNPQTAVERLAALDMHDLPEDLARRVFGLWSKSCLKLVRRSDMHDPRRYSPATSRGVIFARRSPDGPYQVVSVLGLPGWEVGSEVKAQRIVDAARPLEDR